jgi:toxin FitB
LDSGITHFFEKVEEDRMYLSTITIGEIQKGIDLIPWPKGHPESAEHETRRRLQAQLEQRLETLCDRFDGRLVTIDDRVARQWGRFHAEGERAGRKTLIVDTLIAACAQVNRFVIVSADGDFAAFSETLTIYNPRKQTISGYRPWMHH